MISCPNCGREVNQLYFCKGCDTELCHKCLQVHKCACEDNEVELKHANVRNVVETVLEGLFGE